MVQKTNTLLTRFFPAIATGLLLTLSFPKPGFFYLAFFALVPWMLSLGSMTPKESFYSGLVAGLFHYLTLIYWIIPTLHVYGGLHSVLAVSTLTLLCLYLALYPAVFALLLKKCDPGPCFTPLLASCLWAGLEYVRTYAFTGFSWGALGYSQYSNLLLIQIADVSGVYGVSFVIVLVNSLVAVIWAGPKGSLKKGKGVAAATVYTLILAAGALIYGHLRTTAIDSQIKTAQKPTIAVVQGNIRQDLKWTDAFKTKTLEKYMGLSYATLDKTPELIIWPETALPFYYGHDRPLSEQVDRFIRSAKTHFLIGSPAFASDEKKIRFYNRAYLLDRFSIVTGTYDKHHLVPFGEYVPFGRYLSFLGKITAQAGDFSIGDKSFAPLSFNNHKTGVLICFEILFPSIAGGFVNNGADILTTLTNDAWFGRTSAAEQHFSIAVFRAVESRRSLARAANTGISGFIDPVGRILETTPLFTDQAIVQKIPALKLKSFYSKHGDVFAGCAILAFGLAFVVKIIRKKV